MGLRGEEKENKAAEERDAYPEGFFQQIVELFLHGLPPFQAEQYNPEGVGHAKKTFQAGQETAAKSEKRKGPRLIYSYKRFDNYFYRQGGEGTDWRGGSRLVQGVDAQTGTGL